MVQGQRGHSPHRSTLPSNSQGVAERLVQMFNKSLRNSRLPLREALHEFLMQYQRTSLLSGYTPSELLNGTQIHTKLDAMVPSLAHVAQGIPGQNSHEVSTKGAKTCIEVSTPKLELHAMFCIIKHGGTRTPNGCPQ